MTDVDSETTSDANAPVKEETNPTDVFRDGSIDVFIRAYEKRGDGINAYLVYKIETRVTNIAGYRKAVNAVWRRFSDFLGLRDRLVERFQPLGVVVPMAPEKSMKALTTTKLNSSNEETYSRFAFYSVLRRLQPQKMQRRCREARSTTRAISSPPRSLAAACNKSRACRLSHT